MGTGGTIEAVIIGVIIPVIIFIVLVALASIGRRKEHKGTTANDLTSAK
jgi:hypothetical protein